MSAINKNPWQSEGVSILPKRPADLMPLVGQKELFDRLSRFRDSSLNPSHDKLSGFFVLHGGWGVGKSRIGHEVCLEAVVDDVDWIVDGKPQRLLEAGLQQCILPLFTRYIQVRDGKHGDNLSVDNWIPTVAVEAIARLAEQREGSGKPMAKNQDRLLDLTVKALRPKGWDKARDRLLEAVNQSDVHQAAKEALGVLKELGIKHLWLVVDEIEDITDVKSDGLDSEEREPIDQSLLTVIPRVIKAEEVRQEYPEVDFLLLCSLAVGDLLKQVRAIERRTERHELRTNAFTDVEAFFEYCKNHRPAVAELIGDYPSGLKEVAFFAANRNFGWFNVIMHHAHENHKGNTISTPELLRRFGQTTARGGEAVFDQGAIGSFRIEEDEDSTFITDAMYGMLPRLIGPGQEVKPDRAERLLAKRDVGGARRPLFAKVLEVKPPPDHRITMHLVKSGFRNEAGTVIVLPGEVRFDLKLVVESLRAYSAIALPEERREHLLICEDEAEFTAQIMSLSPYAEQAEHFAPFLHGLLTDPAYILKNGGDRPLEYLTPAFTFLFEFNRLNKRKHGGEGYLRDRNKNTRLEEAFRDLVKDPKQRERALLQGLANAWDVERAPIPVSSIKECKLPSISMQSSYPPLNLGPDGTAVIMYAANATEAELDQDLQRLTVRHAAEPVVLILEGQDQQVELRAEEMHGRIARNVPRIAPFIAVHSITRQVGDYLTRLGLMGEAFEQDDLRTSHFHAVTQRAREHFRQVLSEWRNEQIDKQGLALQPLFYGSKVTDDDLVAFAKGYAAMLCGQSYQDVVQMGCGVFLNETERDWFKRMVDRQVDPGEKYKNDECPLCPLVANQSGEILAQVPRAMVAIMERCSHVPVKQGNLERRFLFDLPTKSGITARPRDIIRHFVIIMDQLGLIHREGEEIKQMSEHVLSAQLKGAEDWLDGKFEGGAKAIRTIYHDEGDRLINIRSKEARQWLKEARGKLKDLKLEFVGKEWKDLNVDTSDDIPVYDQRLRDALNVIGKVRDAVQRVYDARVDRAFSYNPEVLREFERNQQSNTYPLWKRLKILQGFYQEVQEKRRELIARIDALRKEVDKRVPALENGEKAFPIQAITQPLAAFRQELDFSADKPNRTVTAGGSTMGITTVGYKLCDGRYQEALDRLETLDNELSQPGKLAQAFMELLKIWEGLCEQTGAIGKRLEAVEAFFADATASVRSEFSVDELKTNLGDLRYEVLEGGIRQSTDNREEAGVPAMDLVPGLKGDLDKLRGKPDELLEKVNTADRNVLPSLEVKYNKTHEALVSAVARIRSVMGTDPLRWPDQKASTYAQTEGAFENLVRIMREEGAAYFKGETVTTFELYQSLCGMVLAEQAIDWNSDEYGRHVEVLKRKNLLELRLV